MTQRATNIISEWHAHIYYDPENRAPAAALREAIEKSFTVRMGRWHDGPVGPHPQAMYQLAFDAPVFGAIVPWLTLNRGGLTVFIHPDTGDPRADHEHHAIWLGEKLALNLDALDQ